MVQGLPVVRMAPIASLSKPPLCFWPEPLPELLPEPLPEPLPAVSQPPARSLGFPLADTLILGYGNSRRGDDGLGPSVAAGIDRLQWLGVKVAIYPQLSPGVAAELAGVRRAIFVDAGVKAGVDAGVDALVAGETELRPDLETLGPGGPNQALPLVWPQREQLVWVRRLRPEGVGGGVGGAEEGQVCSPAGLLGLAQTLYRERIQAWSVTVLGVNCERGDRLSPLARLGRNRAIATIKRLLRTDGF